MDTLKTGVLLGGLMAMFWCPLAQAGESVVLTQAAERAETSMVSEVPATSQAKGKSSSLFWIVLVLSLLFVLGSALALNALGGKPPPSRRGKDGGKEGGQGGQD